ncbi:MAG TPA: pantoate--beta-alanine ligase [Solimonas sp.]|nr:pantoate--beta-alanine ligase [Solimonas sp.]
MLTLHTVAELRAQVSAWRRAGARIGFVPTMGNLHRGHLELVRRAREVSDKVVASIFVNPLQFGPTEDFGKYPRTLQQDQAALAGAACDLLFAPSVEEMYPRGQGGLTKVSVPGLSGILCGQFRPGHFDGVATVVNLLFNQVQPDAALFGEKDYQQLLVIRRMTADLQLPVTVIGIPTEREPDGLALSSRNQYLSPAERRLAPALHAVLREVAEALKAGRRDFEALREHATKSLDSAGFRPQYLEIRSPDLAEPTAADTHFVVLAAAHLGATRLIDNLVV